MEIKKYTGFQEKVSYDVQDVEIFAVGTWNGDTYNEKDLDDMVSAFHELKAEIKPYIKLGHDKDQKLLQEDGMPAAGWVTNLKRQGGKLLADLRDIPKILKELIEKKAYGRFSSEIYWDLEKGDKVYRRVLKALALLGADTPAVSTLDDFINLYIEKKEKCTVIKNYDIEGFTMADETTKELTQKVYAEEIAKRDVVIIELNTKVKTLTEDNEKREQEKKTEEIKVYIDKCVTEGKILPAQVKEYTTLAEANLESVQALVKNMPKIVDFTEQTKHTDKKKVYAEMTDDEKDKHIDAKTVILAKKDSIDYKEAYSRVLSELTPEVN